MSMQREEVAHAGAKQSPAVMLTPQARRLLEGPVLSTLLRLAAPTVALMLLQGIIAAGEAAFVGRLGAYALAGVSLSFPMVMLMTTLSAGAFGGGVAAGVARALGSGRANDAARLAGTALALAALLGLATTTVMLLFGRAFYIALGATGPALEAAVLYSNVIFVGAVPFWLFTAAASILRGGGNAAYPAFAGAIGGLLTLGASPVLIYGAGPVPAFGIAGAAWAVVAYNVAMAVVLLRAARGPRSQARPDLAALFPRWNYAVEILRISVPSAGSTLLSNLTFVVLTALVAPFGSEAIAGYGAGGRLEYLLIPIVFGVGSALGATGRRERWGRGLRKSPTVDAGRSGPGVWNVWLGWSYGRPFSSWLDGPVHWRIHSLHHRRGLLGARWPGIRVSRPRAGSLFHRTGGAGAWCNRCWPRSRAYSLRADSAL